MSPTPDQARNLLRRELLAPEYHEQQLLTRIMSGLGRLFDRGVSAVSALPLVSVLAAAAVLILLGLAVAWLLSRLRASGAGGDSARPDAAGGARPRSPELRRRAAEALAAGRPEEALLDGFRALALAEIEAGRLDDRPGMTAHEVASVLAGLRPAQAQRLADAARLFDLVRYGRRPATLEQAAAVLELDRDLAGHR